MAAKPVESECLDMFDYNPTDRTLTLYFSSGRAYVFDGVPTEVVVDFLLADSKGAYFNSNIKHVYRATRIYPQFAVTDVRRENDGLPY